MVQAAKLYYELGLTQETIARRMNLTRWTVGRLLRDARTEGVVRVEVVPLAGRLTPLEGALQRRFGLRDAVVVPVSLDHEDLIRDALAHAAARYLSSLRPSPPILAVSWGRTMAAVARAVDNGWANGVHVVLMNGGSSRSTQPTDATGVAERLAATGRGTATLLPVPAILGERSTREALERDTVVASVLDVARAADVACYSLGALSADSVLVESGYLDIDDIEKLGANGAVGDVLSRFIGADGTVSDPALDGRTVGLTLDDLSAKPYAIGVAGGAGKHAVTTAALIGGLVTVLVTDEHTARHALEQTS